MLWRNVFALSLACWTVSRAAYHWQTVVWGGGGYVTGIVFHPGVPGLLYARTDVGGAYRRDPGSRTWTPLLGTLSGDDAQLLSVLSVAVDPAQTEVVYAAAGLTTQAWGRTAALLRSADRGRTWTQTELPIRLGGAEPGRARGERLQVDPNLGSVLYLGTTKDGLYTSADAGRTWARVTAFPSASVSFVVLDAGSGAPGAATPRLFAGAGAVLFESTDAGASWRAVTGQPSGGGLQPLGAAFDGDRKLYLAYANAAGPYDATDGRVYVYGANASWTDITPATSAGGGYGAVSVSPRSPDIVAVATLGRAGGDDIYRSLNGGRSWTAIGARSTQSAADRVWIGPPLGAGIAALQIDPVAEAHVVYGFGSGVSETDDFLCGASAWRYGADGLGQSRVAALASPASGAQLFVTQGGAGNETWVGQGIDYAHWWPNFMARTADADRLAWLTGDNGQTWSPMPTSPAPLTTDAGRIAVAASGSALVWAIAGRSAFTSADGGRTWTGSVGYPTSDAVRSGRFFAPVADRFQDGCFYTYDFVGGRLLESTDGGRTFAPAYHGLATLPSADLFQLVSLPTKARDLWLAAPTGLFRFNGRAAAAPVRIAGVQAAYGIGYGAAAPGRPYPALYLSATIAGVAGLFQSVDEGASWTRIDAGLRGAERADLIAGDQNVFGRVWVAPGGRGVVMGTSA